MSIYKLEHGQRGTSNGPGNAKGLRIGHINAQGLKSAESATKKIKPLKNLITKHDFDVFGITETHYFDQTQAPTITGYQRAVSECRNKRGGGGVAVYVKQGVDYRLMDSQTYSYNTASTDCMGPEDDHPVQFIHIKVTRVLRSRIPHIHVVIIYVPPNAVHKLTALIHFLQDKMRGYSSVVVLGDVNENAFQSKSNHTKKVKESGFGQIITEVTRPKSGTLLDHIYVKAFPFSESLSLSVRDMVKHFGIVQTRNTIGDHELIFCVVRQSYLQNNYENTRAAHNTLLKSLGEEIQQAQNDLRVFSIRLIQHLVREAKTEIKTLTKDKAICLCCGLSISALNAMEYHNRMLDKWPTQLKRMHITCGGKDLICLDNDDSNELGRFLYLCIFSGAHKLKLQTMKLNIIDKSSLVRVGGGWARVDRQWSLQLKEAVNKITDSTSRGVGTVQYTVPKSTYHQNYHAYVASLVSELDVLLTPGERGARTRSKGTVGVIFFSAGTKYELTSSFYEIIAVLRHLNLHIKSTSWQYRGKTTEYQGYLTS